VKTVSEMNWRGIKNGELLRKAAGEFDVFITSDKNIEYQQYKNTLPLPVIIIATKGNMWQDILPVIPKIQSLLETELSNEFYAVR
jgi:hypothetical protein